MVRPFPSSRRAAGARFLAFLAFLALAALLALAASSCAPKKGGTGDRSGVARDSALIGDHLTYDPRVPVNHGEKIKITFWTQIEQEPVFRELIADYTAIHPNVSVELASSSFQDHFSKLLVALRSGIGPDLFHLHNSYTSELLPYMESYPNTVMALDDVMLDFRQVASHIEFGSKIYFIDTGLMTSCIYYNKAMWKEAGLTEADFPRTWTQLRAIAKKLTRYDGSGRVARAGFNPNGVGSALLLALDLQQGQRLFASDGPNRPLVDTKASAASLAFLRDLYKVDRSADVRLPEAHESLGLGVAAMIYGWGWANTWLKQNSPKLEYGVFPTPSWTSATPPAYDRNNGESSMGVNIASSKDRQAVAFDLIKYFLASKKYLVEMCLAFGVAPSKYSLDSEPALKDDPLQVTISKILDRTVWPGPLPSFYEEAITQDLVDAVIIDGRDPRAALAATQAKLAPLFRQSSFSAMERQYRFYKELSD
jgi:multiple sugar transport system substrate-binding protein